MSKWKVFYYGKRELLGYTLTGTFSGEEEDTKELLAHENGIKYENIEDFERNL